MTAEKESSPPKRGGPFCNERGLVACLRSVADDALPSRFGGHRVIGDWPKTCSVARLGLALTLGLTGCGGGVTSQRFADAPVGVSHELGAPKNTSYSAELETEKDVLRLTVFEQSECERIRVRIVSRTQETLRFMLALGQHMHERYAKRS